MESPIRASGCSPTSRMSVESSLNTTVPRILMMVTMSDLPDWSALMRPETLRAYLDCRSDSDLAWRMKALKARGYPGMDEKLGRHVKAVVDQYLFGEHPSAKARKSAMRRPARGEPT
jgi:hypothetical protein